MTKMNLFLRFNDETLSHVGSPLPYIIKGSKKGNIKICDDQKQVNWGIL